MTTTPQQAALDALLANHAWHQEYDDIGGYPGSELEIQNLEAIAKLQASPQAQPERGQACEVMDGDPDSSTFREWFPARFVALDLIGGEPIVQRDGSMPILLHGAACEESQRRKRSQSKQRRVSPPKWGRVDTVADLVRNLLTLDQSLPMCAGMHADYKGERVALTGPVSVSRERVQGRFIDCTQKDAPYSIVVWAGDQHEAAQWVGEVRKAAIKAFGAWSSVMKGGEFDESKGDEAQAAEQAFWKALNEPYTHPAPSAAVVAPDELRKAFEKWADKTYPAAAWKVKAACSGDFKAFEAGAEYAAALTTQHAQTSKEQS